MLATALTCAVVGLDGAIVEVEVDLWPGLSAFTIVGLPDAAVQEPKEWVRAAIWNSDCAFPSVRPELLAPIRIKLRMTKESSWGMLRSLTTTQLPEELSHGEYSGSRPGHRARVVDGR